MPMPPEAQLETFDYTDFGVGIRYLAEQLVDDDWIPDAVLGVVRGGLFVAAGIAYALDLKDVRHVNVEFYTDAGETLPEPDEFELPELELPEFDEEPELSSPAEEEQDPCRPLPDAEASASNDEKSDGPPSDSASPSPTIVALMLEAPE